MNNNDFDKYVRKSIKDEVKVPNDLQDTIMNTVENIDIREINVKQRKHSLLRRIFQTIVSVITILAASGVVYSAVTGNSILKLLGLEKASVAYEEKSVGVNETISSDYVDVTLKKIACDNVFLIVEYDIVFSEMGMNEIVMPNAADKDEITLIGGVYVNGKNTMEYSNYTEQISEKEYSIYNVISLMDIKSNDLKLMLGAYYLEFNGIEVSLGNTYCFYVDLNLNDKADDIELKNYTKDNIELRVSDISNSSFAELGLINATIYGISSDDRSSADLIIKIYDENDKQIDANVYLLKNIVTTENDEEIDILEDYNGENLIYENRLNIVDSTSSRDIYFEKGIADLKMLLMIPNEILESSKLTLKVYSKDKLMFDEKVELVNNNQDITINEVCIDTNYSDKSREYSTYIYESSGEKNPYYNPKAEKIDLTKYEINGLYLGMDVDEALNQLEKVYKRKGIDTSYIENFRNNKVIQEETLEEFVNLNYEDDHIEEEYTELNENGDYHIGYIDYIDNYFQISFKDGSVTSINLFDAIGWEDYGMTEKEFVSSYYSEKEYTVQNESVYKYNILYGSKGRMQSAQGEEVTEDFAYISQTDYRDSFISYNSVDGKSLGICIDPTTKVITSLMLNDIEN